MLFRPASHNAALKPRHVARRLVDEFGSTRRKKQMVSREQAIVSADAIGAPNVLVAVLHCAEAVSRALLTSLLHHCSMSKTLSNV